MDPAANLCFNSELSAKLCFPRCEQTDSRIRNEGDTAGGGVLANLCFSNGKLMGEVTEQQQAVGYALDKAASRDHEKELSSADVA